MNQRLLILLIWFIFTNILSKFVIIISVSFVVIGLFEFFKFFKSFIIIKDLWFPSFWFPTTCCIWSNFSLFISYIIFVLSFLFMSLNQWHVLLMAKGGVLEGNPSYASPFQTFVHSVFSSISFFKVTGSSPRSRSRKFHYTHYKAIAGVWIIISPKRKEEGQQFNLPRQEMKKDNWVVMVAKDERTNNSVKSWRKFKG